MSGDAPPTPPNASDDESSSVADRAKIAAWRTKRGTARVDAMARYIDECDRQLRTYGSRDADSASGGSGRRSPTGTAAAAAAAATESARGGGSNGEGATHRNVPAGHDETNDDVGGDGDVGGGGGGVLLCPRGLAAVPLLCAAASESRSAYLARLQVTPSSNGVSV